MKQLTHLIILMVVAFCLWIHFKARKSSGSAHEWYRAEETMEVKWDPTQMRHFIAITEEQWTNAMQALSAHNLSDSSVAYHRAREIIGNYVAKFPDRKVARNLTLKAWNASFDRQYQAAAFAELDQVLDRLEHGEIAWPEVNSTLKNFEQLELSNMTQRFNERRDAIVEARIQRATNWVRFIYESDPGEFTELVQQTVEAKWNGGHGQRAVRGDAMSAEEYAATWKNIHVTIQQIAARYRLIPDNPASQVVIPGANEAVLVTIQVVGNRNIATTWDHLKPVGARVTLPEELWKDPELRARGSEGARKLAEAGEELYAKLREQLEALPEFKVTNAE